MGACKDLTGQRFGMLTVQYKLPYRDKNGAVLWHCLCDCGGEKDVPSGRLNNGHTTSCGCKLSEDLTGKKIGFWNVLYKTKSDVQGIYYMCRCDCGTEREILGHYLRSIRNKNYSCGCKDRNGNIIEEKDLTGQVFGKLFVLYKSKDKSTNNNTYWHCQCECGNEIDVSEKALLSKKRPKTDCGKCSSIKAGEKYNRLTAIKPMGSNKYRAPLWLFKCDCGNDHVAIANAVKNGSIKSCGCLLKDFLHGKAKDLTGQRFGKLIALKQMPEMTKDGERVWECQCDCGRVTYVKTSNLTSGSIQSCGCLSSKGELLIEKLLKEQKILFETQKTFNDCRFPETNYPAKFDFWVNNEYLIEYDGEQHFDIERHGAYKKWQPYDYVKKHDEIKNDYCITTGKPLIRIPYTHLKNLCIEDLLLETTQFRVA